MHEETQGKTEDTLGKLDVLAALETPQGPLASNYNTQGFLDLDNVSRYTSQPGLNGVRVLVRYSAVHITKRTTKKKKSVNNGNSNIRSN